MDLLKIFIFEAQDIQIISVYYRVRRNDLNIVATMKMKSFHESINNC